MDKSNEIRDFQDDLPGDNISKGMSPSIQLSLPYTWYGIPSYIPQY